MNLLLKISLPFLLTISTVKANDLVFTPINVSHGLSDNQVRYISQLSDGRMVFTTSGNLNIYDGVHFKYIHRTPQDIYSLKGYDGFYRIYPDKDSLLWIKDSYKLMCVNLYQQNYISGLHTYFENHGIRQPIEDFFADTECNHWVKTAQGLVQQETLEVIDISGNDGNLQDVMTDENKLYLFYNTGEVVCYDLKTKNRLYSKRAYAEKEHLLFKNTSLVVKGKKGFYQLRNGSKGGFFFFDPVKGSWETLLVTDHTLNTLIITPDERAWISCSNGIWIIDPPSGSKQYLPLLKTVDGNSIDTEISTLFYDKQGGLWLGTLQQGLLYYHPARYKFSYIGSTYFTDRSTKDIFVETFAENEIGDLFVKSSVGTYQFHPSAENNQLLTPVIVSSLPKDIQQELNKKPEEDAWREDHTAIYNDSRGWKWTGTPDGLQLSIPERQEKRTFYTEDGLINNYVHAILEDQYQNIWITTSYGISKIQIDPVNEKISFINFNSYDGTLTGEYTNGAIFEAADGTLYFGGINGFNVLRPDNIPPTPLPFKPLLTNLFLRGEKVMNGKAYDGRIILSEATPYVKKLTLSHQQNFLTFEFSALNYQNPSGTYYRYQLEGIEPDWQETSATGQGENLQTDGRLRISYTNLPHGKYTLKVMASENGYQWDGEISELNILISAPWWKTPIAYIFYILFLISMVSTGVCLYTYLTRKKLERQHKEEILLLRIRNLIEQCNQLEAEKEYSLPTTEIVPDTSSNNRQSPADAAFLARAIELVEKNLDEPGYSVERLSRDLCMDRTGLYRKLVTLLDKSPSLFIRNIRLQRAAQLILEGDLNITEIAEKVGFSTASYMSKCFQEMYGCRPSEYTGKVKKST